MKRMVLAVALLVCVSTSGFAMQMMDWNWIQQKANQGDVEAIMTMAHATSNPAEAMEWYDKAAQRGNAEAAYWMGMQFLPGGSRGQDMAVATSWLEKAANEGYGPAREELQRLNPRQFDPNNSGGMVGGLPGGRDPMERLMYMAERGDVEAMFRLGQKLFNGGAGSGHDERAAFMWFQKAANAGYTPAMHQLAQMYGRGIGVRQDVSKARYWDMMADRHGR